MDALAEKQQQKKREIKLIQLENRSPHSISSTNGAYISPK